MTERLEVTSKTAHLFQDIVGTINNKYVFVIKRGGFPKEEEILGYEKAFIEEKSEVTRYWIEFKAFCLLCAEAAETGLAYMLVKVLETELNLLASASQVFPDKQTEIDLRIKLIREFVAEAIKVQEQEKHRQQLEEKFKQITST